MEISQEEIRAELQKCFPFSKPRAEQEQAFDRIAPWIERLFITGFKPLFMGLDAPTGCHARGTKILTSSGSIKAVEDIQVGDCLLGPDSTPRKVLRLYRGRETMYRVTPIKGEPFVVNESHILSLKKTATESSYRVTNLSPQGRKRRKDCQGPRLVVRNICIKDYLNKSKTFKHCNKLYRAGSVDFGLNPSLPIPPYILGLWLGDGSMNSPVITKPDVEILDVWKLYGQSLGLGFTEQEKNGCFSIRLTNGPKKENPFTYKLRQLGVSSRKHIPEMYLTASREDRLELLAGLLDSDGHLGQNCFDFINIKQQISEGVTFLARSLGLAAYISAEEKGCQTGAIGLYHRVSISGGCDIIPTRVPRKQASKRKQIKDVLVTGFKLEALPEDDYFGFELDGDHLYLMGDFTVTHNSGKSPVAITIARAVLNLLRDHGDSDESDGAGSFPQIWIVTQNKLLQDQYDRDFQKYAFSFKGLDNYPCHLDPGKTCGQSKCGRIYNPEASFPKACSRNCGYDQAKRTALVAPILILNVAKAFTMLKADFQPPVLMIFDEGHGVESALDSESAVLISPEDMSRMQFVFESYFRNLTDIDSIKEGLEKLKKDANNEFEIEQNKAVAIRDPKRLGKLELLGQKTAQVVKDLNNGIEFVSCSKDKLDLRPLKVHELFRRQFTFPVLFMSATLLSKKGFEAMTGLTEQELDWFAVGSPFPAENRKVHFYWRFGATPLNYQNLQSEMQNVADRIRAILDQHPDERGIIHTHTYKNAETLVSMLYAKYGSRLLFPKTAAEQKICLETHARKPNSVLISPSMTEGVDLKDSLCRFVVLVKVPYLPMNDPVVEARMAANKEWYAYRTAMTIVQAPGRGVRSEEDHAETYLVDPGFSRVFSQYRHHFPEWFLISIQKGFKAYF